MEFKKEGTAEERYKRTEKAVFKLMDIVEGLNIRQNSDISEGYRLHNASAKNPELN